MASKGLARAVAVGLAAVLVLSGCESKPNELTITKGGTTNVKVTCI